MVLVEEKNLTKAYPIRQFSFYGIIDGFPFVKHTFLMQYRLYSPEIAYRHTWGNLLLSQPVLTHWASSPHCASSPLDISHLI